MSPWTMRIWWSRLAMRDRAAIGSPWEPVQTSTTSSSGRSSSVLTSTTRPARDLQIAQVAGDAHVADHRAADEGDPAAVLVGRVEDLLDAVHVAGEAGHDDALLGVREDLAQDVRDVALGRDEARDLGVRRVGEEEVDALLAQPREGVQVGEAAVQRELVHLEVAGVRRPCPRGCGWRPRGRPGWSG